MDNLPFAFSNSVCGLASKEALQELPKSASDNWAFNGQHHRDNRRYFCFEMFKKSAEFGWFIKLQGVNRLKTLDRFSELSPNLDRISRIHFLAKEPEQSENQVERFQLATVLKLLSSYTLPECAVLLESEEIQESLLEEDHLFPTINDITLTYCGEKSEQLLASFSHAQYWCLSRWPQEAALSLEKVMFQKDLRKFKVYGTCKFGFNLAKYFIDRHIESSTSCNFRFANASQHFSVEEISNYRPECQLGSRLTLSFRCKNRDYVYFLKKCDNSILRVSLDAYCFLGRLL
ncbi:hypothetical protein L596_025139 [Steinernema carpocapsae]|uniref:Uncharacterized protein n=1 Tax=Steinernema carpocapsae TaxID=34508 RepID=A0A4U5M734_STECR|nr:hypothetical protein L596_025139 [Steinernema carpocapsae]